MRQGNCQFGSDCQSFVLVQDRKINMAKSVLVVVNVGYRLLGGGKKAK